MIDECNRLLVAMLGSEELVTKWWVSPNKAFENQTPESVFQADPYKVYSYIGAHAYG
jgi:hypothetical protein